VADSEVDAPAGADSVELLLIGSSNWVGCMSLLPPRLPQLRPAQVQLATAGSGHAIGKAHDAVGCRQRC
jgi:hypothetical protein